MRRTIPSISWPGLASGALVAVLLGSPALVQAQYTEGGGDQQQPEQRTRKTPAMREAVYKKLSEAQTLAEEGQIEEPLKMLADLLKTKKLNSYELAQIWNFYGFIYFTQERYKEAAEAYVKVLQQENLPEAMETGTLYSLAQLYFIEEDYARALERLDQWFRVAQNPSAGAYILRAQALYQLQRYKDAIEPVETAIAIATRQGKPIKENWLLLLRVFHYELNDFENVAKVLERLIRRYPKKEYWVQLSGMYGELGQERKQLLAYELAYIQGFLNRGRELVTLSQLFLQAEVPYRAAVILEKGLQDGTVEGDARNWRLLSQAWTLAQEDEKAVPALIQAALLSGDGELDIRLAQSYLNLDNYEAAVDAARAGLDKGGLKRSDTANLLLGMALYNLERYNEAKAAFRIARNDQRSNRSAAQWIAHVTNEQARQEQLRAALAD